MNKTIKRFLSAAVVLSVILSIFAINGYSAELRKYNAITKQDALHTSGTKIVNKKGEEIFLRGINLGGWLIQEDWFSPANNNKKGDHYTLETFIRRFGTERAYELYNIYQDNWIQETDFKNIADMGFNCVRIPFWYRNFQYDDNGTWITDDNGKIDLSRLEWAVDMCRKYGLYAILDLHGANGCQGMQDHCGQTNNFHFFDQDSKGKEYRRQAVELWTVIAERFAGDPAVGMFDLLNEPVCDVPVVKRNFTHINNFYDDAYKAIRAKDPDRMITMIGSWDISKLPRPSSKGWTNVVYQYHQYNKTEMMYKQGIQQAKLLNYNVPLFAGEFHPTGDNLTLDTVINVYNSNSVHWALWTYKGYNSWAAWSDWFAYGSVEDSLIVNPELDSYEDIARKWGAMSTNSGNFYKGHLFDVAYKYLPDAVSSSTPFNKTEDIPDYTPSDTKTPSLPTSPDIPTGVNPSIPSAPSSSDTGTENPPAVQITFNDNAFKSEENKIIISKDKITEKIFSDSLGNNFNANGFPRGKQFLGTEDKIKINGETYTIIVLMDLNSDGKISSSDARIALRASLRLQQLSETVKTAADADNNGRITSADARKILRRSLHLS